MSLVHCIYSSAAAAPCDAAALQRILESSRRNNSTLGVTGMLLHVDGSFFQILEGEAAVVDPLYQVIQQDARHCRVTCIIREAISRRSFADWSMGFAAMNATDLASIVGGNDFFDSATCMAGLDEGRAKKLLRAFASGRWRTRVMAAAA